MTLKITSFLQKHKRRIIYWAILLFLLLYFQPFELRHYLDEDIKTFKDQYFAKALIILGSVLCIIIFIASYRYQKKVVGSLAITLYYAVILAFCFYIFQDIILSCILFVNRELDNTTITKQYIVGYMAGVPEDKTSFSLYDLSAKHSVYDEKLYDLVYTNKLKTSDTISVSFGEGLFGVKYLCEK